MVKDGVDSHLAQVTPKIMIFLIYCNMDEKVRLISSFKASLCCRDINQISYLNKIVVLLIQSSHCHSRAAQWLECQYAYISVVEVTLGNTLNPGCSRGVTPADHVL